MKSLDDLRLRVQGRPPQEQRRQRVNVYLSQQEIQRLKTTAQGDGLSMSELIRQAILTYYRTQPL